MPEAPVATRYTHQFVRNWLPPNARTVLEIGCGSGELAGLLARDGLEVVAIDEDAECVAEARKRGVDAWHLRWPVQSDERQFDAILFTRSLHHVSDLEGSVAAARRALRPGGRLIVEDFQAEGASAKSDAWYRGLVRTLAASGPSPTGSTSMSGWRLRSRIMIMSFTRRARSVLRCAALGVSNVGMPLTTSVTSSRISGSSVPPRRCSITKWARLKLDRSTRWASALSPGTRRAATDAGSAFIFGGRTMPNRSVRFHVSPPDSFRLLALTWDGRRTPETIAPSTHFPACLQAGSSRPLHCK